MLIRDDQTIIAQCTPQGSGALALLRLSGADARIIADSIGKLPQGKRLKNAPSHTVHYGWVTDQAGDHLDQVLFIVMDGPHTFTGQHVVEITCHNNPFLIDALIARALAAGARLARPGEFAERAFMAGKIDLVQAEAINELIGANTQFALKQSLKQLAGSFSHWLAQIEKELIKTLAWCEASFEFLDDESEFGEQIHRHLEMLQERINSIQKTFNRQQHIRQGIRISIVGLVNAGKSSLFNRLIGHRRAIVSDIAGTTRDSIEAGLYRNGNFWTLVDTAGLRQTDDIIEQEGIKRSHEEAQKADIVVIVIDASRTLSEVEQAVYAQLIAHYGQKSIVVYHKIDQVVNSDRQNGIAVSSLTGYNLEKLEQTIEHKITQLFAEIDLPFLLNKRQYAILTSVEQKLQQVLSAFNGTIQYELLSYHLRDMLEELSQLTGKSISEAGMDAVFREFCVGK